MTLIDDKVNFSCVATIIPHTVAYDIIFLKKSLELIYSDGRKLTTMTC